MVPSAEKKRDGGGAASAPSPLDIALSRKAEATRRGQRTRANVLDAVLAEAPAALQKRTSTDPDAAQQWASALQAPVQQAVQQTVLHAPQQMAQALAPVMPEAIKIKVQSARRQWWQNFGRFLSGLGTTKVWHWMVQALWEGEPVADYVEQRAGSAEVVELILHDPQGTRQLAYAALPGISPRPEPELMDDSEEAFADDGRHYQFVGERCKLSARVIGEVQAELKCRLQALCYDLDQLLEDTALDSRERARLLPLKLRSGLVVEGPFTTVHATRRAVAAVLGIAGLAVGLMTWIGVGEYRWQRFLEILQREPGIQVVRYERAWGRSSVEGVRMDSARDPVALAVSLGLDPSSIEMNFKAATAGTTGLVQEMSNPVFINSVSTLPSTAKNSSTGPERNSDP